MEDEDEIQSLNLEFLSKKLNKLKLESELQEQPMEYDLKQNKQRVVLGKAGKSKYMFKFFSPQKILKNKSEQKVMSDSSIIIIGSKKDLVSFDEYQLQWMLFQQRLFEEEELDRKLKEARIQIEYQERLKKIQSKIKIKNNMNEISTSKADIQKTRSNRNHLLKNEYSQGEPTNIFYQHNIKRNTIIKKINEDSKASDNTQQTAIKTESSQPKIRKTFIENNIKPINSFLQSEKRTNPTLLQFGVNKIKNTILPQLKTKENQIIDEPITNKQPLTDQSNILLQKMLKKRQDQLKILEYMKAKQKLKNQSKRKYPKISTENNQIENSLPKTKQKNRENHLIERINNIQQTTDYESDENTNEFRLSQLRASIDVLIQQLQGNSELDQKTLEQINNYRQKVYKIQEYSKNQKQIEIDDVKNYSGFKEIRRFVQDQLNLKHPNDGYQLKFMHSIGFQAPLIQRKRLVVKEQLVSENFQTEDENLNYQQEEQIQDLQMIKKNQDIKKEGDQIFQCGLDEVFNNNFRGNECNENDTINRGYYCDDDQYQFNNNGKENGRKMFYDKIKARLIQIKQYDVQQWQNIRQRQNQIQDIDLDDLNYSYLKYNKPHLFK